jgi:ribosomal-protein-alanine N-acetyltransferase
VVEPDRELTTEDLSRQVTERVTQIATERLLLRPWREADRAPWASLNADPEVMAHFVAPLTREQSDAFLDDRLLPHLAEHGYGMWAVERRSDGRFLGSVGLMWQTFPAPFTPALEVGWRLARHAWGHGYATEAAGAGVVYAFEETDVSEVVSMTAPANVASIAVMRRLHMTHDPADDFEHPRVPPGHPLRRHVLHRLSRRRWVELRGGG